MNNILLIVLDAVRKDHLLPYGYDRPTTPALEQFANHATKYEHAISAAPWTPPSHAAIFTGKYPSHCRVFGREPELGEEQPTLAETLSQAGYSTFGFSNSHHTSIRRGFNRGFALYHDIQTMRRVADQRFEPSISFAKAAIKKLTHGYDDFSYFQMDRLKRVLSNSTEPFLTFINLNSAHSPYNPPPAFKSKFERNLTGSDSVDKDEVRALADSGYEYMIGEWTPTDAQWKLIKCWYDGEIAYLDSLLGSLFDFLRAQNLYEDTTIIVTSDHGEHFGEHGLMYHQFSLSETLLNVPLLVKWPGQRESEYSTELVSLTDIAPTCLDLVNGEYPQEMNGRSLLSDEAPEAVFAEYGRPPTGLLQKLVDAMFSQFDAKEESIDKRLQQYHERVKRYDRGLQAVRTEDYKFVRSTIDEKKLYRVGDNEQPIDNETITASLSQRLKETLGQLPTGTHEEELPEHVQNHLEQMGYL